MTSFEQMLKDSEARIMKRLDKLEEKIDETSDFQSGLRGAAKIGLGVLTALGIAVGIYVALHGGHGSVTPG